MRIYFKNLDGIRFIAALLVVLHHAQFFKGRYGLGSLDFLHQALETGRTGVNLFFVLSGFLISYLLMEENEKSGTINFKNFYIRRMLRIWPLYLAYGISLTLLAPFVFTKLGFPALTDMGTILTNLLFLLLFAVNFQLAFFPYNTGILEITWSVCVEEQFYLLWPLVLLLFRNRLKQLFVSMLALGVLSKLLLFIIPAVFNVPTQRMLDINYLMLFDKLELFGSGMFGAYILFHRHRYTAFLQKFFTRPMQWLMLSITVLVVFNVLKSEFVSHYYLDNFIHAGLFAYLMMAAVSENCVFNFEYPVLRTLGKVSYGIYLFHTPVCQLVMLAFMKVFTNLHSIVVYDLLYPAVCVGVTCIIAYYSYELFEKHFLKLKTKFAFLHTRI